VPDTPKPPDLDATGQPVTGRPPDLDAKGQPVGSGGAMNFAIVNGVRVPVDDQGNPISDPTAVRTWADTAEDVAKGVAKGVGNTVYGLGKIVHDYTPVGRLSDVIQPGAFAPQNKPPELTPTNIPQKVGYGAEQLGEFLVPLGDVAQAGKVADVGRAAVTTLAQTGSPAMAGVSGALTAAVPGASTITRASDALQASAEKAMVQALGATKEWAKAEAAKIAPQMLERGIGGTRAAMLDTAQTMAAKVGANLNQAYTTAAQAGQTVPSTIIAGNIQLARDALQTTLPNGARVTIPGTEAVVSKLNDLADFVQQLGPDIPVDKAAHIKRTWDQIISKAGLFGPKAAATAIDSANAWAFREAAGSFRDLLNTNPTIADLNKEASFWTGLKKVLTATELRTQAQRGGLIEAIRGTGGAVAGAAVGGPVGAGVGQVASQQLSAIIASPWWKTQASAPFKAMLSNMLASGNAPAVAQVVGRITAAMPATVRQQLSY
jgi:hypothetical protein